MHHALDSILPASICRVEFNALTTLLDDGDPAVALTVRDKLHSYGAEILPVLRAMASHCGNRQMQVNIQAVIQRFRLQELDALLTDVRRAALQRRDIDLEWAMLRISAFGVSDTDPDAIRTALDKFALRVHEVFISNRVQNELNLVLSLNHVLFDEEKFRGADNDYYEPENSFIQTMLVCRQGIPISLAVLYMLVAERCGIDIQGIGMPAHFVVYNSDLNVYIDAYSKGVFLSRRDCKEFLANQGLRFSDEMLTPVNNISIVARMLNNLMLAYSKKERRWEADALHHTLHELQSCLNGL